MTDEDNINTAKLAMLGPTVWVVVQRGWGDLWTYAFPTEELAIEHCWQEVRSFWSVTDNEHVIPDDIWDAMDELRERSSDDGGAYESFEIVETPLQFKVEPDHNLGR
jgi:hypothetical protein